MTLAELRSRLEGLTGPDRETDRWLGSAFRQEGKMRNVRSRTHFIGNEAKLLRVEREYPRYTASIDAALALVERVLPGTRIRVWQREVFDVAFLVLEDGGWWDDAERSPRGEARTLPLAILRALLIAKEPLLSASEAQP